MSEHALEQAAGPELARQAREGDRGALARLLRAHEREVRSVVLAHVSRHDADDVMQEVYLKASRAVGSLRDTGAAGGWLCAVARSCARSHLRKQRVRRMLRIVREPQAAQTSGAWSTGEVLEAIRELPAAYRETLLLRLVGRLSGEEIAARTGLTHGSVRVNLTRGMQLLRRSLREEASP